jgi:hypothetical protein
MELRRAFVTRWYVTLAGVLVTIALCVGAASVVPVQYEAKSVTVLIPPPTTTAANPYTNLTSVTGLTDVLGQALTAPESTAAVKKAGNVGTYTVTNDVSTSGPLVLITALSDSPEHARNLANFVTDLVPGTLIKLQNALSDLASKSYITSRVINPVDKTIAVKKNRTRAMIVAAGVGLLLTVLLVAAVERFASRRRRKNAKRPQPAGRPTHPTPTAETHQRQFKPVSPRPSAGPVEPRKKSPVQSARHGRARDDKAKDPVQAGLR